MLDVASFVDLLIWIKKLLSSPAWRRYLAEFLVVTTRRAVNTFAKTRALIHDDGQC